MSIPVRLRTYCTSKRGNTAEEYEDAFWPTRSPNRRGKAFRCAVADGATEASFSAQWARMLARAYCRGELTPARFSRSLSLLQDAWTAEVSTQPLAWYAEEKLRQGAFSSLAGLTLTSDSWHAVAVGDSCLFQVRDDGAVVAFPLKASVEFGNTPHLLSSNPRRNGRVEDYLHCHTGDYRSGDSFFLMTDALARWFLASVEREERPWSQLGALRGSAERFRVWLESLRDDRLIRNDDSTLLHVEIL